MEIIKGINFSNEKSTANSKEADTSRRKTGNSLLAQLETAFCRFSIKTKFESVKDIIDSDESSVRFIREVLHDENYHTFDSNSSMFQFSKSRAQHSVLTFLVGLVFMDFCGFKHEIFQKVLNSKSEEDLIQLWMLTALYHDWGYYSEDLKKGNLNYANITKYDLLSDTYEDGDWLNPIRDFSIRHPHVLAYDYEEIKAYDRYARLFHEGRPKDTERVDHGILAGIKVFDRLAKGISKNQEADQDDRLLKAKIACLTIAQHNIFKSSSVERDSEYGEALKKLHSTSDFRVSMDTPLLLLLSLVDTFECIKRFGQADNERAYLQKTTILNSITITIHPDSVAIDYTQLANRIQAKDTALQNCFAKYISCLCGIDSWTQLFVAEQTAKNVIIQSRQT